MMDQRRLNPTFAAAAGALVLLLVLMAACAAVYDDEDEWESYTEETEIESVAVGAEEREEPVFVERKGSQLVVGEQPFYVNGFNAYWLMQMAVDAGTRDKVTQVMADAVAHGLGVCRTWAFADGGWHALQKSPGVFDEEVFRALDFVVAQARAHGLRLILSLSNNWDAYGGKAQYLRWGLQAGAPGLSPNASADAFFTDPTLRGYFQAAVTAVVTRLNSVTGVAYRDDPAIMAWELMNEARCPSDPSGETLRAWLTEMALHVKSLDNRHLVTTGLEGFYAANSSSSSASVNPNPYAALQGSDFVRHHAVAGIDLASAHAYSDAWLAAGVIAPSHIEWAGKWARAHIEDADNALGGMPLIMGEFGVSARDAGFNVSLRDQYFTAMYDALLDSIRRGGAGAGALLWQLLPAGMDYMDDGYAIVLSSNSSNSSSFVTTAALVKRHSFRVNTFNSLCSTTCRWRCRKPRPSPRPGPPQAQAVATVTAMTCPSSSSSYCEAPLYY